MHPYRRKRPRSPRKPGRKLLLLLAGVLIVFSFGKGLVKIGKLMFRKQQEQGQFDQVRREKEQLDTEIARLESDSLYIEEIARKEYGMIRKGEEVYRMSLPDSAK